MLIAALPPAAPPARVVAGVHVTWPLSAPETTLAPGSSLTVRIASKRRRANLSLVRVNAQGRGLGLVAAKTLRNGSFTVKVPNATPGARYALRLRVAGHKRWSWITTPVATAPAPPPVTSPVASFCGPGPVYSSFQAEIRPATTTVHPGETLAYTIANTADGPVSVSAGGSLWRLDQAGVSISADTRLDGGATLDRTITIPADAQPGSYRLVHAFQFVQCDYVSVGGISTQIEVVAPG